MASSLVCAFLFRWVLSLFLLGASCLRVNGISFVYLCCLMIIPLLPNPTRRNFGGCSHTGNLQKAILGLSVIALVAQITFQIVLASMPPYGHFFPNCSMYEQLAREIGLNRFDKVPYYTVVRYILPDVLVFTISLTCVLCSKSLANRPASRPESPQKAFTASDEPTTVDNIMPYLTAIMLLAAGIIQPSVITVIYFLIFLVLGTIWACHRAVRLRYRKAFASIRLFLMVYSGLHFMGLYLYQFQFFQSLLPSGHLVARLLGLVAILYTNCDHPQVLHIKQNLEWPLVSSPGVILLLYWILATETRIYFANANLPPSPIEHMSWWNPSSWSQRSSSETQNLISSTNDNRNYNTIERPPQDTISEESVQPVSNRRRGNVEEESAEVQGTLGSIMMFLMRQSYIAALIIMMAWSITYHSWLTFVLLLWACLIWITPFARWFCMVSSPGLVLYSEFLLLVQYTYGLRLNDEELPIQDSTGTFDYSELGLKKWKFPCFHLAAQTLFTWVFWVTLRQHIREKKIMRRAKHTTQSGIPLTSLAHPFVQALRKMTSLDPHSSSSSADDDGLEGRASDDAKALMMWVKSVLAKYWIILCCVAFLLVGLQNEVSVYQIGYMAIFLFIIICYQISLTTWRLVIRPLWWVMVIYSICILLLIYTYQFDNMPMYWHNATGLSDQWLYNLGLRQHTKASLLMELLTPTAFSIIIVIQLHFFHRPFMAMIDLRNAKRDLTESNIVITSRYQSIGETIHLEEPEQEAATNTNLPRRRSGENSRPREGEGHGRRSPVSLHHQKSSLVSCLIKMVQLYNDITVLLWRLAELHISKLVNFILICVVVNQVCAVNAVIIILLGISMPSHLLQRALSYCFLIWSSLVVVSKMFYQLRFVQADLFQHNCTDKTLPVPANISHFTNNALWVGFYKTDVISEDIKGYLFIVIGIVLQAVVRHHQKLFRTRKGVTEPESGILFPAANRDLADKDIIHCIKYMLNKFFFHFGWEISLLAMVYNLAARCDVTSVIYAIWLGVLLALGRKSCAVVWPVYVGFLAFLLPFQYLICLGWPPGLCLAYPWTSALDPNLVHWLYLTDVTYPPDPKLLIGDFLQLLLACCQENVFSLERYARTIENPSQVEPSAATRRNNRPKYTTPDFMWNITWLDFSKLILFQHLYWITLAVVYITVQSTVSIFNIGFILWCFFFLWHGQALYLQPKKKLLRLWKTFICYNYFILVAKVCLQAVSCVWMQSVQLKTGCWPLQLLSMFCLRDSGYKNKQAMQDADCVAPDDTGLGMDCACITFLVIQYRIFSSDYFRHVVRDHREQSEMADRGAELVQQKLREQLDGKLMEDKLKMDRIRRSVNKLVEKLARLHPAGVEYEPQSHYEAIYSGDYYWFESDSESDSEAETPSVSPIHAQRKTSTSDDDDDKVTIQVPAVAGPSTSGRESVESTSATSDFVTVPTPEPSTAIVEPEGAWNKVKRWMSWIYYYIAMAVDGVIKVMRAISKNYRLIADQLKKERKEKRIEKLRRAKHSHLLPRSARYTETSDSDVAESKISLYRPYDDDGDSLSLVDAGETDVAQWKHSQMRVARLTVAFVYALLAHTDIICYMLMILNHMVYACLLSMPLPFLVFMWGMLSIPRPTKRFWITVITYTQVVIVIKYLFKFPFIKFNTCDKEGTDKDDPLCYPRIFGIERVTHTSAYDLLLLLALYFHRYSLKVHGLWRDKAVDEDELDDTAPTSPISPLDDEREGFDRHSSRASTTATDQTQEHEDDGETLWNKIVRSIKAFLHRIYDPETGSGAVDVYAMMFACQFIIFIIVLFSWSAFSSPEPQRQAQFVKIVEENVVPKTFLYMLLTQFFLIIIDRCLYLKKYVFAKLLYLMFLVVGFHVFMFIIVPYVTKRPFYKNIPAIFMYIFMCTYFGLSAYQIRCGYPTRILGNFLTKSYSLTSGVLFQGFQAIPFVLELRSVLDWACTDTTLSLYHWLKMEDIFCNIYVIKCYRDSEKTWFQARGQKYWLSSKCILGGLLICLLVLVIWFPLLLMSYINSVYTENPPQDATFTLSIGGYQPLFRVSAQEQFLQQLNDTEINKIKKQNNAKSQESQQIDTFLRDYRERGTVELVKITGNSSSIWQISPPSRQLMMKDLLGVKNVTMKFKYEFTREPKTALVQETISGHTLIQLGPMIRSQFAAMLNKSYEDQQITIYDMFPTYVNVPASGSATAITALYNASYVTCGLRMRSDGSTGVEWWELTQIDPPPLFEESVLEMITFNDLVPPLHFSFFASTGIIGLYVGFVWLVGKFVRLFFTSISYRIMFDEMPNVDKVLKLCLDIFMVRESKSFKLEEDLFAKLMFLYRSPETLMKWTKYKRH